MTGFSGHGNGSGSFKETRTFNYNTAGQLTSASNPENGAVSYTYYADGLPQSKTDAKNQTLWFFYDANHRLLRIESPQGTVKTSFTPTPLSPLRMRRGA